MITIFLGPTLTQAEARKELDAEYPGPAAQGDVYRAVRQGATAIGLIDGFFHSVPSVWHKEILWALAEGVPVYGSASMGALRAAELWPYGMIGVGQVFEWFRDGILMDDDEVALAHADAEHGYMALSEPMVDLRATIDRACREEIIDAETADALLAVAKELFYPERDYLTVIRKLELSAPSECLQRLAEWYPRNRVSVKALDALAMLKLMAANASANTSTAAPEFWFERTALWDDLVREANDWQGRQKSVAGEVKERAKELGELAVGSARDAALARVLALDEARRQQYQFDDERLYQAVVDFRLRHNLLEPEDIERWIKQNDLDQKGFLRLAADEARIEWVRAVLNQEIDAILPDHLRVTGQFQGIIKSS